MIEEPDDEINLLDLALTIAENIKLLILGPLIVGLAAVGVTFILPHTYQSFAILNPEANGYSASVLVTQANSAIVLNAVRQATNFEPDLKMDEALAKLRQGLSATVGRQDKLVTLSLEANTPQLAQAKLELLINELITQSKPRGANLERLEVRIEQEKQSYQAANLLEQKLAEIVSTGKATETTTNAYAELVSSNASKFIDIQELENSLQGVSTEDILQPPTLPDTYTKPKKARVAVLATLASGFVLLLFVFVRQALRKAAANPESAAKLSRIRQLLFGR